MERLTKRNESGQAYYKKCFEEPCEGMGERNCNTCNHSYAICEALAAYEDLEITPEQVRQIDKAYTELCVEFGKYKKLENRCIQLPCAVGDIAYRINRGAENPVIKMNIANIIISLARGNRVRIDAKDVIDGNEHYYDVSHIGKTIFLSREAAEQALKQ